MQIPGTINEQWADFSEYMIWRITDRNVLLKLRKKRYRKAEGTGWFDGPYGREYRSGNYWDYLRKTYGLEKEKFKQELFAEEFGFVWYSAWFKALHRKLRPAYHEHFMADLKNSLERLIKEGLVIQSNRNEGVFIREEPEKTRSILAWYYYPKMVLEWEPAREFIWKGLKWVVIFVLGLLGLSKLIDII